MLRILATSILLLLGACGDDDPAEADGGGGGAGGEDAAAAGSGAVGQAGLEIEIDSGKVLGKRVGETRAFLGIPFAATTAAENRWKPPQPVEPWSEPRDATEFGPVCPQINPSLRAYDPASSEDCLRINVWTTGEPPSKPLPVMVWFHGGAFLFGSGGPPYEAQHLVERGDVVVVTFNYRLGLSGFLAHPALSAEADSGKSGAYGMFDQLAALRWVQENIASFGGDKKNVTIFGESAGARSVCWHLFSSKSRDLFHRAIVQSGLCLMRGDTLQAAEAQGQRAVERLGCKDAPDVLVCLRDLPATELAIGGGTKTLPGGIHYRDKNDYLFFEALIDGDFLAQQPEEVLAAESSAKVPVLHGTTTSEGALFHVGIFGDAMVSDEASFLEALRRRFGADDAPRILAQYPISTYGTANEALSAVTADALFVCGARTMARQLERADVKNYLYSFDGRLTGVPLPPLAAKAFHSADIPFVFGNPYTLGGVGEDGRALSEAMMDYWLRFAKSGDPNGEGAVSWPTYTTAKDEHLALAPQIEVRSGLRKQQCDFWEQLPTP